MLVKCEFGSQKTVKSTLKRSYLSSRFFESVLHLKAFRVFNIFRWGFREWVRNLIQWLYDDFDF